MGIMSEIFKYIGFGLMFVCLGFIGVCVFLYYIVLRIFGKEEMQEPETDGWGDESE